MKESWKLNRFLSCMKTFSCVERVEKAEPPLRLRTYTRMLGLHIKQSVQLDDLWVLKSKRSSPNGKWLVERFAKIVDLYEVTQMQLDGHPDRKTWKVVILCEQSMFKNQVWRQVEVWNVLKAGIGHTNSQFWESSICFNYGDCMKIWKSDLSWREELRVVRVKLFD